MNHAISEVGGNGPICNAGKPFSAFTRAGNPSTLLIFEQGATAVTPFLTRSTDLRRVG
jgi:hypothetical protein